MDTILSGTLAVKIAVLLRGGVPPHELPLHANDAGLSAGVSKLRYRFLGGPKGVGQESEVNQRRLNAVAFLIRRAPDGVPHHRYLETVFEQITEMGLDADVPGWPRQDDLLDAPLAELQHQV